MTTTLSNTSYMFNKLDHLIIAVDDLDAATDDYTKVLGFPPIWMGNHPQLGTENALFPVQNTYLELLSARGRGPGADMVQESLHDNGEGLCGMALRTDNLDALKTALASKDIRMGKIANGKGVSRDGVKTRTWKSAFFLGASTRGLRLLAIEHLTGTLGEIEANASQMGRLDHVVINTNDPDGFVALYQDALGIRLSLDQTVEQWGGRMLFFRLNKTTIEVIGRGDSKETQDSLWGLAWSVDDLDLARDRLIRENVEVSEIREGRKPNTVVCTVKSHTRGVPTLFIQHLAT
ncbi:MAG: glyoxalase-like domain protein [Gammaproteobacteria bacterium]|nr:glyoxalase-like domain protein [Gammaproteobacteria bacterium]